MRIRNVLLLVVGIYASVFLVIYLSNRFEIDTHTVMIWCVWLAVLCAVASVILAVRTFVKRRREDSSNK